jgi:chaperonin cofactor prefoldin
MAAADTTLQIDIASTADLSGFQQVQAQIDQLTGKVKDTKDIWETNVAAVNNVGDAVNKVGGGVAAMTPALTEHEGRWTSVNRIVEEIERHLANHATHMRVIGSLVEGLGPGFGAAATAAIVLVAAMVEAASAAAKYREEVAKGQDELLKMSKNLEAMAAASKSEEDLATLARTVTTQLDQQNQKITEFTRIATSGAPLEVVSRGITTVLNYIETLAEGQANLAHVWTTTAAAQADAAIRVRDELRLTQAAQIELANANVRWAESIAPNATQISILSDALASLHREQNALDRDLPGFSENWAKLQQQISVLESVLNIVLGHMQKVDETLKDIDKDINEIFKDNQKLLEQSGKQAAFVVEIDDLSKERLATGNKQAEIEAKVSAEFDKQKAAANERGIFGKEAEDLANKAANSLRYQLETEQSLKGAHEGYNAALRESHIILQQIRADQELIKGAPFMGADEKSAALIKSYRAEMDQIVADIAKLNALKGGITDPAELARLNGLTLTLTDQWKKLAEQQAALTHPLQAQLQTWVNSWGTAVHQIGTLIEDTIGKSLEALNQWIVTGKFNLQSFMQSIELMGLKLIEQLILQQIMARVNASLNAELARILGLQISAALAPAATASIIATQGGSALAAPAQFATALAGITALSVAGGGGGAAGFHEGGLIRMHDGGLAHDEVPIIAQAGEIMIQKSVAQEYGDFLLALNEGLLHAGGVVESFARGGFIHVRGGRHHGGDWGGAAGFGGGGAGGIGGSFTSGGFSLAIGSGGGSGGSEMGFLKMQHRGGAITRFHNGGTVGASAFGGIHVYAFTDMNALVKHMASRVGQKIIFDTVKGQKIDLGIG